MNFIQFLLTSFDVTLFVVIALGLNIVHPIAIVPSIDDWYGKIVVDSVIDSVVDSAIDSAWLTGPW